MIHINPVGYRPVHQPSPVRPAPTPRTEKAEVPFGLNTISFGHLTEPPKFVTPPPKPLPNVGNRLDYYA